MIKKIDMFIILYLQPQNLVTIECIKEVSIRKNKILFEFLRSTQIFYINNKKEFLIKVWKRWEK